MSTETPAVEPFLPPDRMKAVATSLITLLLKSPLRRKVGKNFMIVHVVGRKSGKKYDVLIGRHEVNGRTVASLGAQWRYNLRGGADIDVTTGEGVQRAHVTVVEDRMEMAKVFHAILEQLGYKKAQYIALKVNVDRMPTVEEVGAALVDRWIGYFDFA